MNKTKDYVECTIPILPVKNLLSSIDYYTKTLGFTVDWAGDDVGSVNKDGCSIMLSQNVKGVSEAWVWIGLHDDALFEIYRSKGVKVRQEPQNHSWAYEMKFEDIDGNVLWVGTGTRPDMPIEH